MAYFAEIENGIVKNIIVTDQIFINSGILGNSSNFIEADIHTRGNVYYDITTNQPSSGGIPLRGNYPEIGYTYDITNDVFYSPQPYPSWNLNKSTWIWEAPIPKPNDGQNYIWNEENQTWVVFNSLLKNHAILTDKSILFAKDLVKKIKSITPNNFLIDNNFIFKKNNVELIKTKILNNRILANEKHILFMDGIPQTAYESEIKHNLIAQYSSYDLAYGHCVLSGLGLGMLAKWLLEKPEIEKITVYEISKEIIELNYILHGKEFFDKIEIINDSINNAFNLECDCLLLDHFIYDGKNNEIFYEKYLKEIKNITNKNNFKLIWFFYVEELLREFAESKNISLNENNIKNVYSEWLEKINIEKMPILNSEKLLNYFYVFYN